MPQSFELARPGCLMFITFLPNLRLQRADWILQAGVTAEVTVWENDIVVAQETRVGPDEDFQPLPSGYILIEEDDPEFGIIYHFPPELNYRFRTWDS